MNKSSVCLRSLAHTRVIHSILFDICAQLFRRKCFSAASSDTEIVKNRVWALGDRHFVRVHFSQQRETQYDRLTMNPCTITPSVPWVMLTETLAVWRKTYVRMQIQQLLLNDAPDASSEHFCEEWLMTEWQ